MAHRLLKQRPTAACGLAFATLLVTLVSAAAAGKPARFVAPANRAPQSTVSVNAPPASAPQANETAESPGIDFAALASFAQLTSPVHEEVVGEPITSDTRPFRPITQVTIDATMPAGIVPGGPGVEQAGVPSPPWPTIEDPRLWGGWAEMDYQWSATRLCHRPLYFEQVNLERYGYTVSPCLQPAISGAHFFLTIPTLPYQVTAQPPRECIYTLGYYRAGSRVPRRWHHLPWDPTAATVEGLLATGLVFAIP